MSEAHISPSQIGQAGHCGWAWEYSRVHHMRPAKLGNPLLTGTIIHLALEKWSINHELVLVDLVRDAWLAETDGKPINRLVRAYQKLSEEARDLEYTIQKARPDVKAVRLTKDWKSSATAKKVNAFNHTHATILAKDEYEWEKGRSFTDAYDATLNMAAAYQGKWQDSPEAILTEHTYQVEHEGLILKGVIDYVGILTNSDGEVLGYLVMDYKTYQKSPAPMKDFVQLVSYDIVARRYLPQWLEIAGLPFNPEWPIYSGLDLVYLLERRHFAFNESQRALATSIIKRYDKWRDSGAFLPDLKGQCDWCEWYDECQKRVGMVPLEVA